MPNEVAELDDRPCAATPRQHVEQRACLARDGEGKILQPPIIVEVIGLAPHQARSLLGGEIGHGVDSRRRRRSVLFEQTIKQVSEWCGVQRCHVGFLFVV